jgi:hypothetical protein
MPMIGRIDKSLMEGKAYNLLASVIFSMRQIKNRYEAIEKEVCSHYVSPDHIVSLGWDMVDWCEKLRKLLEVGRGFKKKDEWCKNILSDLDDLKDVRNFMQHFDREVNKSDQNYLNLLGLLKVQLNGKYYPSQTSWTFSIDNSIDTFLLQQQNRTFTFDSLGMSGDIVRSATFSLAGNDIDLNELRSKVTHAKHRLDNYLYEHYYKANKSMQPNADASAD